MFLQKTRKLIFLSSFTGFVSICFVTTDYIEYKELNRRCIPIHNCQPGNEVIPCLKNYTKDVCSKCQNNKVQPDLISSPQSGDYRDSSCFKPLSSCLADDITYRRTSAENVFCETLKGCKCNTELCYFGDPCLCSKAEKCAENQTLTSTGKCVNCPLRTFRIGNGCGPCKNFQDQDLILKTTTSQLVRIITTTSPLSNLSPSSSISSTKGLPSSLSDINIDEEENNKLYTTIVVILSLLVILLSVFVIIVCLRRPGMRFMVLTGVCWSNAPTTQVEQVETPAGENLLPLNDKKCNDDFTNKKDANIIRPNRNTESDVRNFNRQKPRSDEDSKESVESGYCEDFMSDSATHLIERSMSEPSSTTINISGVPGGFDEHTDNSIAHIYNNQWNVSICNNPVTQESEPHLQLNTKVFQDTREQTSGYESITSTDLIAETDSTSNYSVIVSDNQSETTETLASDLCNANFELRGQQLISVITFQSETRAKESGPDSIDSGVAV